MGWFPLLVLIVFGMVSIAFMVQMPKEKPMHNIKRVIRGTGAVEPVEDVKHPSVNNEKPDRSIIFKSQLVVLVLSARKHRGIRDTIRNTWAKGHSNVFFVVGKPCMYKEVDRETWTCRPKQNAQKIASGVIEDASDLIIVDVIDVYRNLASKLHAAYYWVLEHTDAQYILKTDDDTFVRVDHLDKWLESRSTRPYEMIAAHFTKDSQVHRQGKWAELSFSGNVYPPYPSGSGHVVNRAVLEYMHVHDKTWKSYQGEDTSMGIWIENIKKDIKITLTSDSKFESHSGDCHDSTKFVLGHNVSPKKMRECWGIDIKHTDINCVNKPVGKMWQAFESMVRILESLNAPYTIFAGTVLSWYRDCSLGSSDIDMRIDLYWFQKHQFQLHGELKRSGWRMERSFGSISDVGYEEAWILNGVKCDLFSTTPVGDSYISGLTINGITYPCKSFFTRVEEHTWGDVTFKVPMPIERYLEKKYGNWKEKHISGYIWDVEPFKSDRDFCNKGKLPSLHVPKCTDPQYKLSLNDFQEPSYYFVGPNNKHIHFTASVNKDCDLLNGHCTNIQNGSAKAPDKWLIKIIEKTMSHCLGCLSFDFGSNIGLVSLSFLSTKSAVVSVEPQIDLCCASIVSSSSVMNKHKSWCAGVKTMLNNNDIMPICSDKPSFRDGWIPQKNELNNLFQSLGLPSCYNTKLLQLHSIVNNGMDDFGDNVQMIKIDTDSIDCNIVHELLSMKIDFVSVTFETWANDLCNKKQTFMELLNTLQNRGYAIYHTPAQDIHYTDLYSHEDTRVIDKFVKIDDVILWKISLINKMLEQEKQSLFKLRSTYQMIATRAILTPHFFIIWENKENNVDLKNANYEELIKNCRNSINDHGYATTVLSNSLSWGKSFNFHDMTKGSPLNSDIYSKIISSSHPMVHLADVVRILALWRFGGSYVDADAEMKSNSYVNLAYEQNKMLLMRSPHNHINCPLLWGCIKYHDEEFYVSNGLLVNFSPKTYFLTEILHEMNKKYDPKAWSSIGPHLLTYVWKNLPDDEKEKFILVEWKYIWGSASTQNCLGCDFLEKDFQSE